MSSEIIEVKSELMSVSNQDVEALGKHLDTIKSFVKNQLKEGINSDFAKIPGTPKKALLKPGAEKLMKLFGFSSSVECIDKTISPEENFAMFTYKARIIHIKSGLIVAECEGTANNLETKYEKSKVMNILNTLMKMAQKRAIVGAVILATGASDYFTQDEDEIQSQQKNQPIDSSKFQSGDDSNANSFEVTFGKYKGKKLAQIDLVELTQYCEWLKNNNLTPNQKTIEFLEKAREILRAA